MVAWIKKITVSAIKSSVIVTAESHQIRLAAATEAFRNSNIAPCPHVFAWRAETFPDFHDVLHFNPLISRCSRPFPTARVS
jgi:hypothetical protein